MVTELLRGGEAVHPDVPLAHGQARDLVAEQRLGHPLDRELGDEDLDPQLLLWDMHRNIDHAVTPGGRTVIQFRFPDLPIMARDWWLVITPGDADVCDTDPGYPVAVTLTVSLRHMTQVWRGDLS